MSWIYLFIAAVFEVAWTYSLKHLNFSELKAMTLNDFFKNASLRVIWPLVGYIVFGLGNIVFFSKALKILSAATATSIWMGLTIVLLKIFETMYFGQKLNFTELFFIVLIIIGVSGLKMVT